MHIHKRGQGKAGYNTVSL